MTHRFPVKSVPGVTREGHAIAAAYRKYGYRLREIADFLGVHYLAVNRRLKKQDESDE
jgi:hypothetical protein